MISEPAQGRLLLRMRNMLPSLSRSERKLGELVLNDPNHTVYTSVTALAAAADVGEATVLRFCHALGLGGYKAFKLTLARELAHPPIEKVVGKVAVGDDLATLRAKVVASQMAALQESADLLNLIQVEKAVHFLEKATRILFFGVGSSAHTAQDAAVKFMRIGLPCQSIADPHHSAMTASLLDKTDVAVGISYSGTARDTVDALQTARTAGAVTIAITGSGRAPITRHADVILLTTAGDTVTAGDSITSKITQLYVLDLLLTAIRLRVPEQAARVATVTNQSLARRHY